MNIKPELLAPAGDIKKLKTAILYGADAVYCGGPSFSLRQGAGGLSLRELEEGCAFAHQQGKKVYLTLNAFPHNEDLPDLRRFIRSLRTLSIDAYIVADPGVMDILQEEIEKPCIHLSTQANTVNEGTAAFYYRLGVRRIVVAREVSLQEIREIKEALPALELEAFVHGAMCVSYSGRCLLSSFLTGRDANRGDCAQACRWKYFLTEEKRPGVYFPIEEDAGGTYILNANDLCMIDKLDDLMAAGVSSLKVEGRNKSEYYVAVVTAAYRRAIDAVMAGAYGEKEKKDLLREVAKSSHRNFSTGFYYGKPTGEDQNYLSSSYVRPYQFTGLVLAYDPVRSLALVEQRNKMERGDLLEIFGPNLAGFSYRLDRFYDAQTGEVLVSCPHPQQKILLPSSIPLQPGSMIRKKEQ